MRRKLSLRRNPRLKALRRGGELAIGHILATFGYETLDKVRRDLNCVLARIPVNCEDRAGPGHCADGLRRASGQPVEHANGRN